MLTRWYLNGLLIISVVMVLALGGLWWYSTQPPEIALAKIQQNTLSLDNGMEVELISDPNAPAAQITWTWEAGTLADPDNFAGLHQLFSRVLLYGETPSGYRHLETRAQRDPLGEVAVHVDRTYTRLDYTLSPAVLGQELDYLAQLLQQPALPLEAIGYERSQITGQDAAYSFLAPAEAEAVAAVVADAGATPFSLLRDTENWHALSNDGLARQLAQYANDYLAGQLMHVTVRAPEALPILERQVQAAFSRLRSNHGRAISGLPRDNIRQRLNDAMYQPVEGANAQWSEFTMDVPAWRLLFPWQLEATQRASARRLVAWLNAPFDAAPARALYRSGLANDLNAYFNDDFLVVDIAPTEQAQAEPERVYATLMLFLAQVQNHAEAGTQITRIAGDRSVADPLAIRDLDMDPSLFIHLDNIADVETAEPRALPIPNVNAAVAFSLPQLAPVRQLQVDEELPSNRYELLSGQPQLLLDEPGATLWHYEDNRFGSGLASAHFRIEFPIGYDRQQQARWKHWAEHAGPGWRDRVLWAHHQAQTPAQGLRVTVDPRGINWHYTDYWSEVEPWLYEFVQSLEGLGVELPTSPLTLSEPHRLLRERNAAVTPPPPEDLSALRNTVLLSGRVTTQQATEFGQWLVSQRPEESLDATPGVLAYPQPLEGRHHIAELDREGDRSRVTRVLQLPQNNLRQRTLADWTFPWLQETLTMAVRAEEFQGDLTIELTAPLGHPGLDVQLSSTEQDPARLGLYLAAFWPELEAGADGYPVNRFEDSTHARAALLRDTAQSLPALATHQWEDIVAGRQHFNGRILQARALEGTNIEGWQYFVRQWLFDANSRQLTVFEIGEEWTEEYENARRLPPNAVAW